MDIEKTEVIKGRKVKSHKKGGMSQKRFEKLRKEQVNKFHKKVVDELNKSLVPIIDEIDIIIFGGNIIRAKELLKRKDFDYRVREKINSEVISTSDVSDLGLREAMKIIPRILKDHVLAEEKDAWDSFLTLLMKGSTKGIYGIEEVNSAIEDGCLEILLIMSDFNNDLLDIESTDKIVFFSSETECGQQLKSFGGIAGIKRY